jgi:hypothetical protein
LLRGSIAKKYGEEAAAKQIAMVEKDGFLYVGAIASQLKEYEAKEDSNWMTCQSMSLCVVMAFSTRRPS